MSKVVIRTLPLGNGNYGGVVQAYALQRVLSNLGAEVSTDESRSEGTHSLLFAKCTSLVKRLALISPLRRIIGSSRAGVWERELVRLLVRRRVNEFVRNNLRTVRLYNGRGRFNAKLAKSFDVALTGSDQVWRRPYGDVRSYMLDGFPAATVKASYAASFGRDDVDEYEDTLKSHAGALLTKFQAISVRESSGVNIVSQNWALGATRHIDPTMLLGPNDYEVLVSPRSASNTRYVFEYVLDREPATVTSVSKIIESLGLDRLPFMPPAVSSLSEFKANRDRYLLPAVEDWLSGIRDAEFVVTDSFHGTVFSILFNRPFVAIVNEGRGASRFASLLELFDLESRLISPGNEASIISTMEQPIDWERVNKVIDREREEGVAFLAGLIFPRSPNKD